MMKHCLARQHLYTRQPPSAHKIIRNSMLTSVCHYTPDYWIIMLGVCYIRGCWAMCSASVGFGCGGRRGWNSDGLTFGFESCEHFCTTSGQPCLSQIQDVWRFMNSATVVPVRQEASLVSKLRKAKKFIIFSSSDRRVILDP